MKPQVSIALYILDLVREKVIAEEMTQAGTSFLSVLPFSLSASGFPSRYHPERELPWVLEMTRCKEGRGEREGNKGE